MPYLKVRSNVAVATEQSRQLLAELSQLIARETGKPERYVMVELTVGQTMLFAGNDQPLAYLECKSIGLSVKQAGALSAALSACLNARLGISPDRIYIEFVNAPGEFWGWNGSTFG